MEIILRLSGNNSHLSDLERDHPRLSLPRTLDLKHWLLNRPHQTYLIRPQHTLEFQKNTNTNTETKTGTNTGTLDVKHGLLSVSGRLLAFVITSLRPTKPTPPRKTRGNRQIQIPKECERIKLKNLFTLYLSFLNTWFLLLQQEVRPRRGPRLLVLSYIRIVLIEQYPYPISKNENCVKI